MKLLRRLTLLTIWIPAVLPAGDFNGLVREFSRQTGAQQTRIPFLGLARFVVAAAHPAGTSELKLAVFEHVNGRQVDFVNVANGVASGEGWNRIVRVRSRNGESTNIYMQPDGNRVRMLVTTVDSGDAVFVEMRIKPEALAKFVDEHDGKRNHCYR
jgi:hypothetical protein